MHIQGQIAHGHGDDQTKNSICMSTHTHTHIWSESKKFLKKCIRPFSVSIIGMLKGKVKLRRSRSGFLDNGKCRPKALTTVFQDNHVCVCARAPKHAYLHAHLIVQVQSACRFVQNYAFGVAATHACMCECAYLRAVQISTLRIVAMNTYGMVCVCMHIQKHSCSRTCYVCMDASRVWTNLHACNIHVQKSSYSGIHKPSCSCSYYLCMHACMSLNKYVCE